MYIHSLFTLSLPRYVAVSFPMFVYPCVYLVYQIRETRICMYPLFSLSPRPSHATYIAVTFSCTLALATDIQYLYGHFDGHHSFFIDAQIHESVILPVYIHSIICVFPRHLAESYHVLMFSLRVLLSRWTFRRPPVSIFDACVHSTMSSFPRHVSVNYVIFVYQCICKCEL